MSAATTLMIVFVIAVLRGGRTNRSCGHPGSRDRRTPDDRTSIAGDPAMALGKRAVFLGLVQVVPEQFPAMSFSDNLCELRTALLKFGCF